MIKTIIFLVVFISVVSAEVTKNDSSSIVSPKKQTEIKETKDGETVATSSSVQSVTTYNANKTKEGLQNVTSSSGNVSKSSSNSGQKSSNSAPNGTIVGINGTTILKGNQTQIAQKSGETKATIQYLGNPRALNSDVNISTKNPIQPSGIIKVPIDDPQTKILDHQEENSTYKSPLNGTHSHWADGKGNHGNGSNLPNKKNNGTSSNTNSSLSKERNFPTPEQKSKVQNKNPQVGQANSNGTHGHNITGTDHGNGSKIHDLKEHNGTAANGTNSVPKLEQKVNGSRINVSEDVKIKVQGKNPQVGQANSNGTHGHNITGTDHGNGSKIHNLKEHNGTSANGTNSVPKLEQKINGTRINASEDAKIKVQGKNLQNSTAPKGSNGTTNLGRRAEKAVNITNFLGQNGTVVPKPTAARPLEKATVSPLATTTLKPIVQNGTIKPQIPKYGTKVNVQNVTIVPVLTTPKPLKAQNGTKLADSLRPLLLYISTTPIPNKPNGTSTKSPKIETSTQKVTSVKPSAPYPGMTIKPNGTKLPVAEAQTQTTKSNLQAVPNSNEVATKPTVSTKSVTITAIGPNSTNVVSTVKPILSTVKPIQASTAKAIGNNSSVTAVPMKPNGTSMVTKPGPIGVAPGTEKPIVASTAKAVQNTPPGPQKPTATTPKVPQTTPTKQNTEKPTSVLPKTNPIGVIPTTQKSIVSSTAKVVQNTPPGLQKPTATTPKIPQATPAKQNTQTVTPSAVPKTGSNGATPVTEKPIATSTAKVVQNTPPAPPKPTAVTTKAPPVTSPATASVVPKTGPIGVAPTTQKPIATSTAKVVQNTPPGATKPIAVATKAPPVNQLPPVTASTVPKTGPIGVAPTTQKPIVTSTAKVVQNTPPGSPKPTAVTTKAPPATPPKPVTQLPTVPKTGPTGVTPTTQKPIVATTAKVVLNTPPVPPKPTSTTPKVPQPTPPKPNTPTSTASVVPKTGPIGVAPTTQKPIVTTAKVVQNTPPVPPKPTATTAKVQPTPITVKPIATSTAKAVQNTPPVQKPTSATPQTTAPNSVPKTPIGVVTEKPTVTSTAKVVQNTPPITSTIEPSKKEGTTLDPNTETEEIEERFGPTQKSSSGAVSSYKQKDKQDENDYTGSKAKGGKQETYGEDLIIEQDIDLGTSKRDIIIEQDIEIFRDNQRGTTQKSKTNRVDERRSG